MLCKLCGTTMNKDVKYQFCFYFRFFLFHETVPGSVSNHKCKVNAYKISSPLHLLHLQNKTINGYRCICVDVICAYKLTDRFYVLPTEYADFDVNVLFPKERREKIIGQKRKSVLTSEIFRFQSKISHLL